MAVGGPCDWCALGDGSGGARWLLGSLRHVGLLGDTGRTHEVNRRAGQQVWACDECAPLVRAHDVDGLAVRLETLELARTGEDQPMWARLSALEVFRSIDKALLVELAPDTDRPTPEAIEAFALASAEAGTNGAALAREAPSGAPRAR